MPEGIAVDIDEGRAVIDFIDAGKRGPGVQALIDAGGPEAVEVDTRTGPRKLYIVDEKVARDAGLVDDDTASIPAFDRSSGTDISGIINPETPTSEYTVGQTQRAGEYRGELREGLGTGVSDTVGEAAHTHLNNALTGVVSPITSVPSDGGAGFAEVRAEVAQPAPTGAAKGDTVTGGAELPVGTPPDQPTSHGSQDRLPEGEAFPTSSDHPNTSAGTPEVEAEPTGVLIGGDDVTGIPGDLAAVVADQEPPAPTTPEAPAQAAVEATSTPQPAAEDESYPEGSPNLRWTRKQLNAYAKHEKGIDTTDEEAYPNKDAVIDVLTKP